jgi:hypothetical protein
MLHLHRLKYPKLDILINFINLEDTIMLSSNLQDALEKIGSDNEYCQELRFSPDKLSLDFGLTEDECNSLHSGDSLNHVDKSIRPVAVCCSCGVAVVQPTKN